MYWIEASRSRRGRRGSALAAAPIDVGPALREQLFEKVTTVVMTSATLAVGQERLVRFLQVARRADAGRMPQAGAARSTIAKQAELILLDGMPDPTRRAERL